MSVETWETNGAVGGIDQTKNRITSDPSVVELEKWYAENSDPTLDLVDRSTEAKAGSVDVVMLPWHYAIELKQIRESYDPEELQTLADRMPVEIVDGKLEIDLENAPTINILDRENAILYLEKMHKYHQGEIDPIDIDSLPSYDGKYHILVNGHRRRRALELKCLQLGISPENLKVSFKFVTNMSFAKAKKKQYVENTFVPINPVEDAHAIELHYLFLRDEGEDYSVAALKKVFGYSEDKIRDALRYVTAPEEITKFVGKGINYGNVVELVKLREVYAEALKQQVTHDYHNERALNATGSEEIQEQLMKDYLATMEGISDESERRMKDYFEVRILNRLQGKSKADVGEKIRTQIKLVRGQSGFTTDSLFIYDEAAERRDNRVKVRKEMGSVAIETLGYLSAQGDLSPELLAQLQELIAAKNDEEIADEPDEAMFSFEATEAVA